MERKKGGAAPPAIFLHNGFKIFRNVIAVPDIQKIRSQYSDVHSAVASGGNLKNGSKGTINVCPALEFVWLDELGGSALLPPNVGAWVLKWSELLLGTPADQITVGLRLFHKPGQANGTPRHQDDAYRKRKKCSLTFWVPLDPVNQDNGCLVYERGSHVSGELPHVIDASDPSGETLTINRSKYPPNNQVDAVMQLGDISVHSPLVVHSSYKNGADTPRRALVAIATKEVRN